MSCLLARYVVTHAKPENHLIFPQYAILIASTVNSITKYILCAYEHKRAAVRGGENAPPWENKSMYTFYIDLFTGASESTPVSL